MGSVHPTTLPKEALAIPEVDYVVRGEGDEVLLRLVRALEGESEPTELLGVSFRRENVVYNNPDAPLIPGLDVIPGFPYHLFEHPKYDMGFLTTSSPLPEGARSVVHTVVSGR